MENNKLVIDFVTFLKRGAFLPGYLLVESFPLGPSFQLVEQSKRSHMSEEL